MGKRLKKEGLVLWGRRVFCNGIDWTGDLVGNTGIAKTSGTVKEARKIISKDDNLAVMVDGYNGYWMSTRTAKWWDKYVDGLEAADEAECEMGEMVDEIVPADDGDRYGDEGTKQRIADYISSGMGGWDMEDEQSHRLEAIEAVKKALEENGCF